MKSTVTFEQEKDYQQRFTSFADLCRELEVTFEDGLTLFTKSIYRQDELLNHEIPFMGTGLNKRPFSFKTTSLVPNRLKVNEAARNEIKHRFKTLNHHLKAKIHARFKQKEIGKAKRSRLLLYLQQEVILVGEVESAKRIFESESHLRICLRNVSFLNEQEPFSDHLWANISIELYVKSSFKRGEKVAIKGKVFSYKRFNSQSESFSDDVSVNIDSTEKL